MHFQKFSPFYRNTSEIIWCFGTRTICPVYIIFCTKYSIVNMKNRYKLGISRIFKKLKSAQLYSQRNQMHKYFSTLLESVKNSHNLRYPLLIDVFRIMYVCIMDVLLNGLSISAKGELQSLCCMMGKTMSLRCHLLAANIWRLID